MISEDEFFFILHSQGIKLVFQNMPASLSYYLSGMDKYSDTFDYLLSKGLRGHDVGTAGIHVHIDRKNFGSHLNTAIAKLLFIFEKYREELRRFARRTSYQIDRRARSRKTDSDSSPWIKKTVKEAKEYLNYQDRYYSVNLCKMNL